MSLYIRKENRDKKARELRGEGYKVRVSSTRNQLLHPMYVADYEGETGHILTPADKGFGNTIYKTSFAVLYKIEVA